MTIRHILVPLTGSRGEAHAPLGAMTLATRMQAHVAVAHVVPLRPAPIDPAGAGFAPSYVDEMTKIIEKARAEARIEARRVFDEAVADLKLPVVNHPKCGQASVYYDRASAGENLLADMGPLTDMIVMPSPYGLGRISQLLILEEALFALRRPVLLLPYKIGEIGQKVAVAWNGSFEAANALRACLRLLTQNAKITLLQVGKPASDGLPLESAVDYAGWHGFEVDVRQVADAAGATARIIVNEAKAAGAQLLVMGGYSHSRLRERIFGGVTESVLTDCDLPLLLAH